MFKDTIVTGEKQQNHFRLAGALTFVTNAVKNAIIVSLDIK